MLVAFFGASLGVGLGVGTAAGVVMAFVGGMVSAKVRMAPSLGLTVKTEDVQTDSEIPYMLCLFFYFRHHVLIMPKRKCFPARMKNEK